jgi:IS30 family transposase
MGFQRQLRFWIGALVIIVAALWLLRGILLPFVVGIAIAYFLNPLVERTTLFTVLSRMEDASAESALSGFGQVLNRIESQKRLSLTYDQGKEMTEHQRLTQATGVKVYFADPHSPWQRGINENTNGLLRQYFPKGTDLSGFTQEELDAVAWQLNTRPRKSLGFKCPAELFSADAFDFRHHHASLFALGH